MLWLPDGCVLLRCPRSGDSNNTQFEFVFDPNEIHSAIEWVAISLCNFAALREASCLGPHVPIADDDPLVGRQFAQAHRAAGMQTLCGDGYLGP